MATALAASAYEGCCRIYSHTATLYAGSGSVLQRQQARGESTGYLPSSSSGESQRSMAHHLHSDVPSSAIVRYHSAILDLAKTALHSRNPDEREFFSVVVASDPKQIEVFKDRIRRFQQELMQEMEKAPPKKLFEVAVQMFPLG